MLTFRNYFLIGIAFGLVTYLMMLLFGDEFARWANGLIADARAAGSGGFGETIARPLVVMGENPLVAGVIVGLVWPLAFIWAGLVGVLLLILLLA